MRPFIAAGYIFLFVLLWQPSSVAGAQTSEDSPTLRICSQNLERFGEPPRTGSRLDSITQLELLVQRMLEARCDIIAVQEIYGEGPAQAHRSLQRLHAALVTASGRHFTSVLGSSINDVLQNGFLVADDSAIVRRSESLHEMYLPKLSPLGPPQRFLRGPLAVWLDISAKHGSTFHSALLVDIHFKSKTTGWKDPSGLQFEPLRMEMAEQVRNFTEQQRAKLGSDVFVMILGDKNAEEQSASTRLLSGELQLVDFQTARCRVLADLEPKCSTDPQRPAQFVALFAARLRLDSRLAKQGSFLYRGHASLIDDMFVPVSQLQSSGTEAANSKLGFVGQFYRGSDHKLLWAEIGL
jgi:hypothetical protein